MMSWKPKDSICIHVHFTGEQCQLYVAKLKSEKKENAEFYSDEITSIFKTFGAKLPYVLHLSGQGVLTRLIDFTSGYKDQLVVHSDKNDFYFNSWTDQSKVLVSFFRKQLIADLLDEFRTSGISLLGIYAGPVPVLNTEIQHVSILGYTILRKENMIENVERHENDSTDFYKQLKYIRRGIYEELRSPIEAAEQGLPFDEITLNRNEFKDRSKFYFFSYLLITSVFVLLVLNFLFQKRMYNKINELENAVALNNSNLSLLDQLKKEFTRKDDLVRNSGILHPELVSFYADKLIETVPDEVTLQKLDLFPLKEALKEDKRVAINQVEIQINGFVASSARLDDWMEKINRFAWVSNVELINFLQQERAYGTFELIITVNA